KLAKVAARRAILVKAGQPTAGVDEQTKEILADIAAIESGRKGDLSKATAQMSEGTPNWSQDTIGTASKNPELVAYKLKTNAYKFSWLIIALSVPFVWLLFPFTARFRRTDR